MADKTSTLSPTTSLIQQKATYNPPKGLLSASYMSDLYRRAYDGNTRAIQRIVDFVNTYSYEADRRLSTLEKNQLAYSSPAVYLQTFKSAFSLSELPERTIDDDLTETIGQAKAVRRFLSSPLSRVSNARNYAKVKVDYVLNPSGNINLEARLGRKLTSREKSYLSKILMSASFTDYLDEHYAMTDEILENIIDEFDYSESMSQNYDRVTAKLETELNSTQLLQTLTQNWEIRNRTSLKVKNDNN